MRILLVSQWFWPEPDVRIRPLAEALAERGHQVTVITGFPNYPGGALYPGYQLRWRQWEQIGAVRVLRLPLYPDHSRSAARRILNYLSFAASASLLGPVLCGPADVMWVYHPPLTVGLPALVIGLLRRIPFVYEVQDMWPETLAATAMLASPRVAGVVGAVARMLYRRAAAITVISPGFKRNLIAKGVPADKIHVIPNWADEEIYHPLPRDEALAAAHGMAGRFNVIYGGNLGAAQAIENVLAAAELLRDQPHIQIVLIGDGMNATKLRQQAAVQGLDNVRFIGQQPAERMPHFFALADALLVHLKRDPLFEITIPSKTLAYLACGRSIIAAVAGDAADVVRNAGAGLVCAPEDPPALARAVRAMAALPPTERERMGAAGRETFLASYTRTMLVDRYERLFERIARHSGGSATVSTGWQTS
jgi:colanic acid biosynthesis glycosyl transferase WcaI